MAYYQKQQPQFQDEELPSPMNLSMMDRQENDLLMSLMNLSALVEEVEHKLRGEVYIEGKWKQQKIRKLNPDGTYKRDENDEFILVDAPPLVNETGVYTLMHVIQMHVNKAALITSYGIEDVKRMAWESRREISLLLFQRWKEFGIAKEHIPIINMTIDHAIYGILRSSLNDASRKFIKGTDSRIETIQHTESQPKTGLLSWWKGG